MSRFAPGSTTASATYSAGLSDPEALAFDSSGNLYVANNGNNTVIKFAPGSTTASATYSAGLSEPEALAFDSSGNLYVANFGNATVSKFAPGSTTASATYSAGLSEPEALAFDSSGNLYVANMANTMSKFAPGSTTAQRHIPPVCTIPAPWRSTPAATVRGQYGKYGEQVRAGQHHGQRHLLRRIVRTRGPGVRLQRQSVCGQLGGNTVSKFAPGSTTASATYSAGLSEPGPWRSTPAATCMWPTRATLR